FKIRLERKLRDELEPLLDFDETGLTHEARYEFNLQNFSTSFAGPLPQEVKEALEGRFQLRRFIRTNDPHGGGAEDWIAENGVDAFVEQLELMTKTGRLRRVLELAEGHPDPEIQFSAWL